MSTCLVIGGTEDEAQRIAAAIGQRTVALPAESIVSEAASFVRGISPDQVPEVIVLTPAIPMDVALEFTQQVTAFRPDVHVVLIATPDRGVVLEAMRAGARDVAAGLDDPVMLSGVRERLRSRPGPEDGSPAIVAPTPVDFRSRTITVVSPKGGVGKTSTSTNLAVALAQRSPMEVVVVDLDLQFGDVATVLDLKPSHTLADAFATEATDSLLLKTYLTVHPSNFFVLCGADSPAANDQVTSVQVAALIRQLQQQFRYVVIDTAAGLDDATLGALEVTDDVVLVSTMDIACLRAVRKEVELLGELELLPASRHVVLNFADKQSGLRVKDVEAMLGLPVDVLLPRTKDAPVASNRGVPLMVSQKSGPFVKSVRTLATKIFDRARAVEGRQGHRRLDVA